VEVKAALIGHSGPLGALLVLCERLEQGNPGPVAETLTRLPRLTSERLNLAQTDALR
jgi:c-di-GMP-related signal transduction protein